LIKQEIQIMEIKKGLSFIIEFEDIY